VLEKDLLAQAQGDQHLYVHVDDSPAEIALIDKLKPRNITYIQVSRGKAPAIASPAVRAMESKREAEKTPQETPQEIPQETRTLSM